MTEQINRIKKTRQYAISLISNLSAEELNKIPQGFNNNIIWNAGHMIAAQQGICYVRSGAEIVVDDKYYSPFRPGTKPDQFVDTDEAEQIKKLLLSSIDNLQTDYANGLFGNYPAWSTRYGVEITNIDDAIQFLLYHEGMHTGIIMALIKLVKS